LEGGKLGEGKQAGIGYLITLFRIQVVKLRRLNSKEEKELGWKILPQQRLVGTDETAVDEHHPLKNVVPSHCGHVVVCPFRVPCKRGAYIAA